MDTNVYPATIVVNREPIPTQGRYLSRLARTQHECDFLGADFWKERRTLVRPSLVQCALLVGSNPTAILWAARREEDREEIIAGVYPLIPKRPKKPNGTTALVPTTDIGDSELINIARLVGPSRRVDAAIAVEVAE